MMAKITARGKSEIGIVIIGAIAARGSTSTSSACISASSVRWIVSGFCTRRVKKVCRGSGFIFLGLFHTLLIY